MATDISILKGMTAYHLDVTLWTARTKLRKEDFGPDASNLPDAELATLGSKRIAPPEKLRVFASTKANAVNLLDRFGVRFLGGWLVPDTALPAVEDGLHDLRSKFNREKAAFLGNYTSILDDWLREHPEWQSLLVGSFASPDYIRAQMSFGWASYRLSLKQNASFKDEVGKLGNTLLDSVVKDANSMWDTTFAGRSEITQKTLGPLRSLESKLSGLTLVDPLVQPVIAMIQDALSRMPPSGPIAGTDLATVQGLVCLMRDKDTLMAHASKVLDGASASSILDCCSAVHAVPSVNVISDEPDDSVQPVASGPSTVLSMGLW